MKGADENGFFNVEYRIPDELLLDSKGNVKQKLTFKIVASPNTMCPGLYYLRLLKDYKDLSYQWNAADWQTGDAGRVAQSRFTYNNDNTITIKAGTGTNNLCLSLDYEHITDYQLQATQKYLVVIASNVKTSSGSAYLWWLNGVNHASSVVPTKTQKLSQGTAFIWDMTTTNLDSNNTGNPFSICQGSTIFGLTSTTGTSTIHYIGFLSSINNIEETVSIQAINDRINTNPTQAQGKLANPNTWIDLTGKTTHSPLPGHIYIRNGKKILIP